MTKSQKQRDKIELFSDALIQHGPLSNRIYLMKLKKAKPKKLISEMEKLAAYKGYTKIFAKVPAYQAEVFLDSGYRQEARVPDFYRGRKTALFLGRYLNLKRRKERYLEDIEKITSLACKKNKKPAKVSRLPAGVILRRCIPDDAVKMSSVYAKVFKSYPFPIDNPKYIMDTMIDNFIYFGIEVKNKLVALASAEMDTVSENAEMTDFAALPEFRGKSLASELLVRMEKEMRYRGIQTAYTIARAISPAINITFAKAGYNYAGRLINNTNISGQIESMNVWYKQL